MKVGDYVRYKYENCVYIGKIKFVSEVMGFEETLQLDIDTCMEEILKEDIIKSSPNIIDLIEEDDFINGCRITELISKKKGFINCMVDSDYEFITTITNKEIKRVVTKEQFERMEYKIND